jgi:hypothetical protein
VNYSNTGTGDDFSAYDLENNIEMNTPPAYTAQIYNFSKDNVLNKGEFEVELTPALGEGEEIDIEFTLKTKIIGDGGANDPVLFINKVEQANILAPSTVDSQTEPTPNDGEETFVSSLFREDASANAVAAGRILIVSSSVSGGLFPLCG